MSNNSTPTVESSPHHPPNENSCKVDAIDLEPETEDGQNDFACTVCKEKFETKHDLIYHMDLQNVELKCPYCHFKTKSGEEINSHINSHHRTPLKKVNEIDERDNVDIYYESQSVQTIDDFTCDKCM